MYNQQTAAVEGGKVVKLGSGSNVIVDCCGCNEKGTAGGMNYNNGCNCDLTFKPVCGENGITYINPTAAKLSHVSIAYFGVCKNETTEECYDSDGGKNYDIKGYARKGGIYGEDQCKKGYLVEYYCENNEVKSEFVKCNCDNGICVKQNCKETDNGDDPQHKGTVSVNGKTYEDHCVVPNTLTHMANPYLIEYYCENGNVKNKTYECDYGCENGVCLEEPNNLCSDTDGGKNYYEIGTVSGKVNGDSFSFTDECVEDEYGYTYLREYYCEGNTYKYEDRMCNCENGMCKEVERTTCDDSDGGIADTIKGTVTITYHWTDGSTTTDEYIDKCRDSQTLLEYYCTSDGGMSSRYIDCEYECKDGACIIG